MFSHRSLAIFSLVPSLTVTVSDPMRLSLSLDSDVNPNIQPEEEHSSLSATCPVLVFQLEQENMDTGVCSGQNLLETCVSDHSAFD